MDAGWLSVHSNVCIDYGQELNSPGVIALRGIKKDQKRMTSTAFTKPRVTQERLAIGTVIEWNECSSALFRGAPDISANYCTNTRAGH